MDRRVGNTKGLGAMFGILAAIGGPVLAPDSLTYMGLVAANQVQKVVVGEAGQQIEIKDNRQNVPLESQSGSSRLFFCEMHVMTICSTIRNATDTVSDSDRFVP